ncbi:MAG TPA: ABC transporter permease [Clostridia bacterium]|nr:ABC transporter permease [Clostridia bacterium]
MKTFKAYLKKEIIESVRQYKYLIILIGVILFAIVDPVILKLLPEILKNKIPGDLSSLIQIDRKAAVQNYIKDLSQISLLIVTLTLMSTLSDEISSQKLIFPYSKGCNLSAVVISKILHHSAILSIFVISGFAINYYYATTLFNKNVITFDKILISSLLMSLYFVFIVTLLIFFSSILKRGIIAAISVLVVHVVSAILMNVDSISKFIPYNLILTANSFNTDDIFTTVLSVVLYCIILSILTVKMINKSELI